jgi:hypothetical protein
MPNRWSRLAPLTGIAFALLFTVALVIAATNNTPTSDASGTTVIAFYETHGSALRAGAIIMAFAFLFLLFFSGSVRSYRRSAPTAEGPAALIPVSAAVLVAGGTTNFGFEYALGDVPGHLSPAAAQALNVLSDDLYLTQAAGLCALGMVAGLAILRSALLSRWLGWLALVMGIVVLTPADLVAFIALPVWVAATSISIWRHGAGVAHSTAVGNSGVPVG